MTPDTINGLFELCASLFIFNQCRVLWNSKQADGVSMVSIIFFISWAIWNLIYYPSLGQTFSFYAGILVMIANSTWVFLIWKIRKDKSK
jgi:hypothetical protein